MENVNKQLLDAAINLLLTVKGKKAGTFTDAERIMLSAIAEAEQAQREKLFQPEHVPLTAAGSEDQAVYASIASNYHQPPAVAVLGVTDDELKEMAKRLGMRWDGDFWAIEDADFHPFMRTMLAAAQKGGAA